MLAKLSATYAVIPPCRTPNGCKFQTPFQEDEITLSKQITKGIKIPE
jgi:hypothetical protein